MKDFTFITSDVAIYNTFIAILASRGYQTSPISTLADATIKSCVAITAHTDGTFHPGSRYDNGPKVFRRLDDLIVYLSSITVYEPKLARSAILKMSTGINVSPQEFNALLNQVPELRKFMEAQIAEYNS